jgi:hypothetical protein
MYGGNSYGNSGPGDFFGWIFGGAPRNYGPPPQQRRYYNNNGRVSFR